MLMSEAIRLGAMLRPQCRSELFRDGGSCAIGAALEALGRQDLTMQQVYESWGFAQPVLGALNSIWIKNDSGYTRESIADWLVASGHDFEVSPLQAVGKDSLTTEVELSPADVAAIQELTHG